MVPLNAMLPLPVSVNERLLVLVPLIKADEIVRVWPEVLALMVPPPVVPPSVKTLSVDSVMFPVQVSCPLLLPPPRVILPFVPRGLFNETFPSMGTERKPFAEMTTGPVKLFELLEIVTDPVPDVF